MAKQRSNLARAAGIDPGFQAPAGTMQRVDPRFTMRTGSRNIDPGFSGGSNSQRVMAELAKYPNLDPRAVLAIATHEGLGGGIGDQGTSFGPFQLHEGGAYPSTAPQSPQAAQEWAWSPAGIDYALSRIANVAGGLKGAPAIEAISTRFERPANPAAEIADAEAHYGLPVPPGMPGAAHTGPGAQPGQPAPVQQTRLAQMLAAAIGNANQTVGLPNPAGLGNLLAKAAGAGR